MTRRFTDFAAGEAIHPNDVLLFSEAQYRRHRQRSDDDEVTPTPAPFDPSVQIEWSPVSSLRYQRFKYLPSSLLYFFYPGGGYQHHADSNGCAAGHTLEQAIVQGFLPLVEPDPHPTRPSNPVPRPQTHLG